MVLKFAPVIYWVLFENSFKWGLEELEIILYEIWPIFPGTWETAESKLCVLRAPIFLAHLTWEVKKNKRGRNEQVSCVPSSERTQCTLPFTPYSHSHMFETAKDRVREQRKWGKNSHHFTTIEHFFVQFWWLPLGEMVLEMVPVSFHLNVC